MRIRAVSPGPGHSAERLRKGLGGVPGHSTQGEHCFWEVGRGQTRVKHHRAGKVSAGVPSLVSPWPFSQLAPGPAQPPALGQAWDFSLSFHLGTESLRLSAQQTGVCTSAVLNLSLAWEGCAPPCQLFLKPGGVLQKRVSVPSPEASRARPLRARPCEAFLSVIVAIQ